jgi:hypothetical protein
MVELNAVVPPVTVVMSVLQNEKYDRGVVDAVAVSDT